MNATTTTNPNSFRIMNARFSSDCTGCENRVNANDEIAYRATDRKVYHVACLRNKIANAARRDTTNDAPMTQQAALSNLKVDTYHAPDNSANGRAQAEAFHAMIRGYSADIPATGRKLDDNDVTTVIEQAEAVTSTATGINDGYYTVVLEDGTHRTFRIRTQSADSDFAPSKQIIATLTGSDNTSNYTQWGFVNGATINVWKSKTDKIGNWAQLATALITGDHAAAGMRYAVESNNCYRCNRQLTDPESVATGLGPICRNK